MWVARQDLGACVSGEGEGGDVVGLVSMQHAQG